MSLALKTTSVHRAGRAILERASFICQPGRVHVLCGPNGAGKTTALSLLSGALTPDEGEVLLDGFALQVFSARALARRRAVVRQATEMSFPFKVHEVVAMGRTPHRRHTTRRGNQAIIEAALQEVEIDHLADRNVLTLSGGERQRVHIARALAQIWEPADEGTRWLLLDEPTAALDLKHQMALMAMLRRLVDDGLGVVAVLHDLHLAQRYADRVVVFKDGRVVDEGGAGEQLTPARIQAVFDLPEPYPMVSGG